MSTSAPLRAYEPASTGSTSLVPDETAVDPGPLPSGPETVLGTEPDRVLRHSGWAATRSRVYASLQRTFQSANRVQRFADCGRDAWVQADANDARRLRVVSSTCRDRWCVPCQRERAATIRGNLRDRLGKRDIRFVTLTLRHVSQPLSEQLDHLYSSFRRLRQARWWRDHVSGGLAVLEVTINEHDRTWHPHLHLLVEGRYLPQRHLSEEWRRASRGSWVVDVRRPRDADDVCKYVTKYVTKGLAHQLTLDANRLDEAVMALKGRRLLVTFGKWAKWRLTRGEPSGDWIAIGSLRQIWCQYQAGDVSAAEILQTLYGDLPCRLTLPEPQT